MPEYIERDKLPVKQISIGGPMMPRFINVVYADDIAAVPAADVVPVVYGEVEVLPTKELVEVDCMCKACSTRMRTDDNYCPNCGAKMDGAHHVE